MTAWRAQSKCQVEQTPRRAQASSEETIYSAEILARTQTRRRSTALLFSSRFVSLNGVNLAC